VRECNLRRKRIDLPQQIDLESFLRSGVTPYGVSSHYIYIYIYIDHKRNVIINSNSTLK